MPLTSIKCSSQNPAYTNEELSFDKCLSCARVASGVDDGSGMRWCNAPYALIRAMQQNSEQRKDAGLSVTMLLDSCPRRVILQQENDYSESPMSYWARFRGTIGHLMMEEYDEGGEGIIQEVRFSKKIKVLGEEIEITGKMDHVDTVREYILDYKSVGSINTKPINQNEAKEDHALQVNFYHWLLRGGTRMDTGEQVDHPLKKAAIIYFDMKGITKVPAPLLDLQEVEDILVSRLEQFVLYQQTGVYPDVLTLPSGKPHYLCQACPVKSICDSIVN